MDPIKIALMGGMRGGLMKTKKPKGKPAPIGGRPVKTKPDVPLPGYPIRRGLDEPTQFKGKPRSDGSL